MEQPLPATADRLLRESQAAYPFLRKVGGVVPGYTGHRPGSRQCHFKASTGGVVDSHGDHVLDQWRDNTPDQPWRVKRPTSAPCQRQGQYKKLPSTTAFRELGRAWKAPEAPSPNEVYLKTSGGVKVKYAGFVPHGRKHFGSSHVGYVDGMRPDKAEQAAAAQAADAIPEGQRDFGTLLLPSMIEDCSPAARRTEAGRVPPQPLGGAIHSYSGHRPREASEALSQSGSLAQYGGEIGTLTPWRRPHRQITVKVGSTAASLWTPERMTADELARSEARAKASRAAQSRRPDWSVNDWRMHQSAPPPPLPTEAADYRSAVGGIVAGYAGSVPQSQEHVGSSHVGMHSARARQGQPLAQRGHVGKSDGRLLFNQPTPPFHSEIAATAALGYSGHRPAACHGFGISLARASDGDLSA